MTRAILRRVLLRTLALAAAVVVLLGGLAYYLTATGPGFRQLVALIDHLPGIKLKAEEVAGTPAKGLTAGRLSIHLERLHVEIGGLRLRLRPLSLLGARIDLADVSAASLVIDLHAQPKTPSPNTDFLPRGLRLSADAIGIGLLRVRSDGDELFTARDVRGAVRLSATELRARDLAADAGAYRVGGSVALRSGDPIGLDGAFTVRARIGSDDAIVGALIGGNLDRLTVQADGQRPEGIRFLGVVDLRGRVHVAGRLKIDTKDLAPLSGNTASGPVAGGFDVSYDGQAFVIAGTAAIDRLPLGKWAVGARGNYRAGVLTLDSAELRQSAGSATVTVRARVDLEPATVLSVDAAWSNVSWPPLGRPTVTSPRGNVHVVGPLNLLDVLVTGDLRSPALPPVTLAGNLTVEPDKVTLKRLVARTLGGAFTASGVAELSGARSWTAEVALKDVNPGQLRPMLAGRLDAALSATGAGFDPYGSWQATLHSVGGTLRGHPVHGTGGMTMRGGELALDHLAISLASLHASANGRLGKASALSVDASVSDISEFIADSHGSADIRGTYSSEQAAEALKGDAHARGLRVGTIGLETLSAHADIDSSRTSTSTLALSAHRIVAAGQTIEGLTVEGHGIATDHGVGLSVTAPSATLVLHAHGAYGDGTETLHVEEATEHGSSAPTLTLESPTTLTVGHGHASLEGTCMRADTMRLCAGADWKNGASWSANLSAESVPLRLIPVPVRAGSELLGSLSVSAAAHGAPDRAVTGTLRAELQSAGLRYRLSSGRDQEVLFGTGTVDANADDAGIVVRAALQNSTDTFLDFSAHAPRSGSMPLAGQPIDGRLQLRTRELGLAPLLLRELDRLTGLLEADLRIGGTLMAPEVAGHVAVTDGEADIYLSNLLFKQISARATFTGNRLDIDGSARAGDGTLSSTGTVAWEHGKPVGDLRFKGENLLLANLPEARVVASPNLAIKLGDGVLRISGDVRIPSARIMPKDLSNAVRVSPDQVFANGTVRSDAAPLRTETVVRLDVGPDVKLNAYGLKGLLQGTVTVSAHNDDQVVGIGELEVKDGHYLAYARDMDIERGRLIFRGGAVDDAGIDVRASRKLPGYTAGVNVRGTLQTPQISFFSDPSLPQSQIASLLIVGQTPDALQNGGGAGSLLAAQGGALLVGDYTHYLGIDQMTVEADSSNGTALVLGKFLTPRLYVSYGISLAQAINTLKLRYTIGDNWVVNTESGLNHSADVQYSFQR